jgi:predicted metal-dependent enzyme (double-stranded beta helix superfamily)
MKKYEFKKEKSLMKNFTEIETLLNELVDENTKLREAVRYLAVRVRAGELIHLDGSISVEDNLKKVDDILSD